MQVGSDGGGGGADKRPPQTKSGHVSLVHHLSAEPKVEAGDFPQDMWLTEIRARAGSGGARRGGGDPNL